MSQETYTQVWPGTSRFGSADFPAYTYGLPFPEACAKHVPSTLACKNAYIIVSGTLSRTTDAVERLSSALNAAGVSTAGVRRGMQPHTPYSEMLATAEDVRATKADCLITLGGGSLIDGAKGIAFVIANDVFDREGVNELFDHAMARYKQGLTEPDNFKASTMPIVCCTTTLSGGEFNAGGSPFDDVTLRKHLFYPGTFVGPKIIIMDPELTLTTPMRIWLGTGVRALDHCVETLLSKRGTDESWGYAARGLKALVPALLKCKHDPQDTRARLECQLAGVDSMRMLFLKVQLGGSHGIGHQLGPYGVPHGETSCVLLPAVLKYNKPVNGEQQTRVAELLWEQEEVRDVLQKRGLERGKADLGDVLDAVIRELGMPRSLSEVGVAEEKFGAIAESSLTDFCTQCNPRPLTEAGQVVEILNMVK